MVLRRGSGLDSRQRKGAKDGKDAPIDHVARADPGSSLFTTGHRPDTTARDAGPRRSCADRAGQTCRECCADISCPPAILPDLYPPPSLSFAIFSELPSATCGGALSGAGCAAPAGLGSATRHTNLSSAKIAARRAAFPATSGGRLSVAAKRQCGQPGRVPATSIRLWTEQFGKRKRWSWPIPCIRPAGFSGSRLSHSGIAGEHRRRK